jgi:hypothetical protein
VQPAKLNSSPHNKQLLDEVFVISRIIAGATKCRCEKKIAPIGFTKYFFDANFEIYTHEQP